MKSITGFFIGIAALTFWVCFYISAAIAVLFSLCVIAAVPYMLLTILWDFFL